MPDEAVTPTELLEATIADIHGWYRAGRLTPSQLVEHNLHRALALDLRTVDGPPVNCLVRIDPEVRTHAAALDAEIDHMGPTRPLFGIPVWVKDNVDVRGLPTTCGCLALADNIAARDAVVVAKLRAAGAVIMGKTGMTELGNGSSPYSTVSGRIGNAYDPTKGPSGSSNGSAVAVSMNFGVLAVGVDDCGSIPEPSASNGCVGLRPTVGHVECDGLFHYSRSDTTPGPIARSVQDAMVMQDVLSVIPSSSSRASKRRASLDGLRVGVLQSIGGRTFEGPDDPYDRSAELRRRVQELEMHGAVTGPWLDLDDFRLERLSRLEYYNSLTAALRRRRTPPRTLYALTSSGHVAPHNELRRAGHVGRAVARLSAPVPNWLAARYRAVQKDNRVLVESALAEHRLDCLVALTGGLAAFFATLSGTPHLTVPSGFAEGGGQGGEVGKEAGVPLGLSFLGAPGADVDLLNIGAAYERATGGRRPPSPETRGALPQYALGIEEFNRFKERISLECRGLFEYGPNGYEHPTASEFRDFIDGLSGLDAEAGGEV